MFGFIQPRDCGFQTHDELLIRVRSDHCGTSGDVCARVRVCEGVWWCQHSRVFPPACAKSSISKQENYYFKKRRLLSIFCTKNSGGLKGWHWGARTKIILPPHPCIPVFSAEFLYLKFAQKNSSTWTKCYNKRRWKWNDENEQIIVWLWVFVEVAPGKLLLFNISDNIFKA